jgi:hypothetical protein
MRSSAVRNRGPDSDLITVSNLLAPHPRARSPTNVLSKRMLPQANYQTVKNAVCCDSIVHMAFRDKS